MKRASTQIMIAAWVIFFASNRSIAGSIVLALAGLNTLADVLPRIWKGWKASR